uniref:DUF5641 domain-containing protein n=1 Tax=Anopheles funestus TaxID=62324 RepID=A0A182S0B5_ANOFN
MAKWTKVHNNLQPGQIVLIGDDNMPTAKWPMGVVKQTFPSADGLVRVALVKVNNNYYKRNVRVLAPLPIEIKCNVYVWNLVPKGGGNGGVVEWNSPELKSHYTNFIRLQARIKQHSVSALVISCANHFLNLVADFATENCKNAVHYLSFLQICPHFFLFKNNETPALKRCSVTRWSARADAVLALKLGFKNIKDASSEICDDKDEKLATLDEANALLMNISFVVQKMNLK